jgi:DNA-binding transcriptional ArsR family regulator
VLTYKVALSALGEPTRLALYERLRSGPATVGELADLVPVTRQAVSQHLRVLGLAGLVTQRRAGTRHFYSADPSGLEAVRSYFEQAWAGALDQYKTAADLEASGKEETLAQQATDLTVRKSVTVALSIDRAYALFTERISSWWPFKTKSIGAERAESVVLEGRAGGRLYEELTGGGQALWGEVLVWDPPRRLVLSWRVNADDPSTVIEVNFIESQSGTNVELEHRGWENYRTDGSEHAASYDAGWESIFGTCYRDAAAAEAARH